MDAQKRWDSGITGWPFRRLSIDTETNVAMNQRMIGQLLRRKNLSANLPAHQSRALMALGIEVSESREEKAGLSLKEAAKQGGLDPAFLAIVEAGKAVPGEITGDVLASLARGAKSSIKDLKSAMSIDQSYVLEKSPGVSGEVIAVIFSLCRPDFIQSALAFKNKAGLVGMIFDDEGARVSYKVGGPSGDEHLSLSFFEFQNPDAPLQGWTVTLMSGLEELMTGSTDELGEFRLPDGIEDFPEGAHMLIEKPV